MSRISNLRDTSREFSPDLEEVQTRLHGNNGRQKPKVYHPQGRLESEVHSEIGSIIAKRNAWFLRGPHIVTIEKTPSGFEYAEDENEKYKIVSYTSGLAELSGLSAKSHLEQYMIPTVRRKNSEGEFIEQPRSFSAIFCSAALQSVFLRKRLSHINRILTVPFPFRAVNSNRLIYPKVGYDKRFGTYLVNRLQKKSMSLREALDIIEWIHKEFPFSSEQSKTHAIARLITPYMRGFLGWTTRVPLWYYCANRPRAGKDYLAAIPIIVMEGFAFEDQPIGQDQEETAKRIKAAARAGRRFMHFSNCQVYLQDQYLVQAITNTFIAGRTLGSDSAKSDSVIPNEMEYSLSANIGLTCREDIPPRMRPIELAYFDEDPNGRRFANTYLHKQIKKRRGEVISALDALVVNWMNKGFPKGKTPFTSYPEWSEIVGGVMEAAGLGNPCLPFKSSFDIGGDLKTAAMTELFRVCHEKFGEKWVEKERIYEVIIKQRDNDALQWFGDMHERNHKMKLGKALHAFHRRSLGGICLLINESDSNSQRHTFQFNRAL